MRGCARACMRGAHFQHTNRTVARQSFIHKQNSRTRREFCCHMQLYVARKVLAGRTLAAGLAGTLLFISTAAALLATGVCTVHRVCTRTSALRGYTALLAAAGSTRRLVALIVVFVKHMRYVRGNKTVWKEPVPNRAIGNIFNLPLVEHSATLLSTVRHIFGLYKTFLKYLYLQADKKMR